MRRLLAIVLTVFASATKFLQRARAHLDKAFQDPRYLELRNAALKFDLPSEPVKKSKDIQKAISILEKALHASHLDSLDAEERHDGIFTLGFVFMALGYLEKAAEQFLRLRGMLVEVPTTDKHVIMASEGLVAVSMKELEGPKQSVPAAALLSAFQDLTRSEDSTTPPFYEMWYHALNSCNICEEFGGYDALMRIHKRRTETSPSAMSFFVMGSDMFTRGGALAESAEAMEALQEAQRLSLEDFRKMGGCTKASLQPLPGALSSIASTGKQSEQANMSILEGWLEDVYIGGPCGTVYSIERCEIYTTVYGPLLPLYDSFPEKVPSRTPFIETAFSLVSNYDPGSFFHFIAEEATRLSFAQLRGLCCEGVVLLLPSDEHGRFRPFVSALLELLPAIADSQKRAYRLPEWSGDAVKDPLWLEPQYKISKLILVHWKPRVQVHSPWETAWLVPGELLWELREELVKSLQQRSGKGGKRGEAALRGSEIIYFSRAGSRDSRRPSNEAEFLSGLQKENFGSLISIDSWKTPLLQVARAVRSAKVVVGVHGGALANMVFSKSCAVVEISLREQTSFAHVYAHLAAALGLVHWEVPMQGNRTYSAQFVSIPVQDAIDTVEVALRARRKSKPASDTTGMVEAASLEQDRGEL